MSNIRQDPTTKEWVIVAPNRTARPRDRPAAQPTPMAPPKDCPFCPGHEAATPPELFQIPGGGDQPWAVRVISNKFAALTNANRLERHQSGSLFREMDGVGHHEVVVETPHHDRILPLMTVSEVEMVLRAYQARYLALRDDPHVRYIVIFKNHGERAGTSLDHPHSQIVATPVAPMQTRRKYEVAIGHYDDTGRCLYCDLVEAETAAAERVVLETDGFVVFEPFASRSPYETWIAPRRHQASFGQLAPADLATLAGVLQRTLRTLHDALSNPDFNLIVHSAPVEDEAKPYYLWHVQILPRLTTIAGFELGSGIYITTVTPEDAAATLRDAMAGGTAA